MSVQPEYRIALYYPSCNSPTIITTPAIQEPEETPIIIHEIPSQNKAYELIIDNEESESCKEGFIGSTFCKRGSVVYREYRLNDCSTFDRVIERCDPNQVCRDGICEYIEYCGDRICQINEDCSSCSIDCGACKVYSVNRNSNIIDADSTICETNSPNNSIDITNKTITGNLVEKKPNNPINPIIDIVNFILNLFYF